MLILAVDTSSRTGSAAVLREADVLAEVSGYEETPYSTRLFRDVAALQERAKFRMDEIDLFAVASGPGSFTGLRVGLTAVKAWAEIHGRPIAAISGLEAVAAGATLEESEAVPSGQVLAPFLDARRGQVFGALYRRVQADVSALEIASDEAILSAQEFLDLVKGIASGPVLFVSPTPDALPAALVGNMSQSARILRVSAALAPTVGKLGYDRFLRGDLVDPLRLDANYVRRSDAEAAWKDR